MGLHLSRSRGSPRPPAGFSERDLPVRPRGRRLFHDGGRRSGDDMAGAGSRAPVLSRDAAAGMAVDRRFRHRLGARLDRQRRQRRQPPQDAALVSSRRGLRARLSGPGVRRRGDSRRIGAMRCGGRVGLSRDRDAKQSCRLRRPRLSDHASMGDQEWSAMLVHAARREMLEFVRDLVLMLAQRRGSTLQLASALRAFFKSKPVIRGFGAAGTTWRRPRHPFIASALFVHGRNRRVDCGTCREMH